MQLTQNEIQSIRDELSRAAIRATLYRYCQGVDRADATMLMSAYHDDAHDDHGRFGGRARDFVDLIVPRIRESFVGMHHMLGNIQIELDGETARVDSYFISTLRYRADPQMVSCFGGRYLDRFESRVGEWKIARRTVVHDWSWKQAIPTDSGRIEGYVTGSTDPLDPFYLLSTWEPRR